MRAASWSHLLRATILSAQVVYTILDTEAAGHLSLLERDFCTKVKEWCAANLEAEAMAVETCCTSKRGRSGSDEGEAEDTMPEPPENFRISPEELDTLRETLRIIETEFRNLVRDESASEDNKVAAMRIASMIFPRLRYSGLLVAGPHEEVPTPALLTFARFLGGVYGYRVDLATLETWLDNGKARIKTRGHQNPSVLIPLLSPQYAAHGGSPFLLNGERTPPSAFIMKDLARPRCNHEQFGEGRPQAMRQTFYVQAVDIPPDGALHTQVALLRGIHMDQGTFEWSLAAANRAVYEAARPTLDLYPESEVYTTLQFYHRYVRTNPNSKDKATYARANELVLNVSIVTEGYDVDSMTPANLIRKTLMSGPNGNILQAGSLHFLVCPDTQSPEFLTHNFPNEIIDPQGTELSEVSNLVEGLTFEEILAVMEQTCHDLPQIMWFAVQRQLDYCPNTGGITRQRDNFDSLIVDWDGQMGVIDRQTLQLLCPGDMGRHTPLAGSTPGVDRLRRVDNVMRAMAIQPGLDCRPGKIRYANKINAVVKPIDAIEFTPRCRENDRPLLTGSRLRPEAAAVLNTHELGAFRMNLGLHDSPQGRESQQFPSTPSRSWISTSSSALELSSGDRSFADVSMGHKTPGSEVSSGSLEQLQAYVSEQLEVGRRRDQQLRDEERQRVRQREEKQDEDRRAEAQRIRDREAQQDEDRRQENRRVQEREAKQEMSLQTTVTSAVSQTLNFALASPEWGKMMATSIQAGLASYASQSQGMQLPSNGDSGQMPPPSL